MDSKPTQGSTSGYAKSISLPEVFRNLKNAKVFAVDIGKSLSNFSNGKMLFCSEERINRG